MSKTFLKGLALTDFGHFCGKVFFLDFDAFAHFQTGKTRDRGACFFCGGAFLMLADALCRWSGYLLSMGTIPVGVLTTLLGGPFFIWLLRRKEGVRVG